MGSAMEEWARRQLAVEDFEHDMQRTAWARRKAKERAFRAKHPFLARLFYGKPIS